jgi:ubiquinone/menaquinone biosynthesis C-methylase UbiE
MSDKPVAAGKSSFDLIDTAKTLALLNVSLHSTFVDLACGVGNYSVEIAKIIGNKGTVYAVDLWQEGIKVLDQKIDTIGITNIQTIMADICKTLPLEPNSVDSCLMATVVHDLPASGQKASLEEVARILKVGGVLNIIEFKKIDKGPGPPLTIRMAEQEIESLVTPFGFIRVQWSEVGEFNYLLQYKKSS